MQEDQINQASEWRERPLLLAGLGLVAGLLVHLFWPKLFGSPTAFQLAITTAITSGFLLFGFTVERSRWVASAIFAAVTGLVAGLVIWWNGPPGGWSSGEAWRIVSLFLAVAIAAPLFQAARDEGRAHFPYPSIHDHAWTNVVLWVACWVFVGLVFAMLWLLAALFMLIDLDFLKDLLGKEWVIRALIGFSLGGALGMLREHDAVVRLLQRVMATVLAVLAPALAVGLVLFILSLPFTGLNALWQATRNTTPILLSCVVGALILANAVIGNMAEQERRNPALRLGATALAVVMLPLAIIAAIATGLRIGQYGFTPERLWACVFVALACFYGAAYLGSVAWKRLGWPAAVRRANLGLAFLVCGLALLLATPLISFNAISTRDQLARLESGRVTPDNFDWRALAFDFGEPGRAALKRLQQSSNPTIRTYAADVGKAENRWDVQNQMRQRENRSTVARNTRVLPQGAMLPPALLNAVAENYDCTGANRCTLLVVDPGNALLFSDRCYAEKGGGGVLTCQPPTRYVLAAGKWVGDPYSRSQPLADPKTLSARYTAGDIEIRTVPRRQAFVGGVPVGEPFE